MNAESLQLSIFFEILLNLNLCIIQHKSFLNVQPTQNVREIFRLDLKACISHAKD